MLSHQPFTLFDFYTLHRKEKEEVTDRLPEFQAL
jgi:hypothetical protein